MDKPKLKELAHAYRNVFSGPLGEKVKADLERFGFENETTFNADPRVHAVREGRRQYWLYVKQMLNLDVNKIGSTEPEGEDNE
jgi:hypothetical protein